MSNLEKLEGKRFLVLGRAGMDLYADPVGCTIEEASRFEACLGGSAANIAVALCRQGCQANLISAVSNDAVGRFCNHQMQQYGIGNEHVSTVGGEARNSLAVVETRLENCQSVIYRNGAADFQLTPDDIDKVDFRAHDALIVTGTALADQPSRDATMHALQMARHHGLCTIIDLDYRPYSWQSVRQASSVHSAAVALCDIVVGNDLEFDMLAGGDGSGLETARQAARQTGRIVVYKMGEKGAITMTPDETIQTGVFSVQALKPTGAGDSFMGGFIASLANDHALEAAVLRGSACAAMVVTRVGCAPAMPDTAELAVFLSENDTGLLVNGSAAG